MMEWGQGYQSPNCSHGSIVPMIIIAPMVHTVP